MYLNLPKKSFSACKILRKYLVPVLSIFMGPHLFAQVSFTANVSPGCAPLTVTFTNTSATGNYYIWQFGDGTESKEENPVHIYDRSGYYHPSLEVYDTTQGGMNYKGRYDMPNEIYVKGHSINSSVDSACLNQTINFGVWPDGSSYQWDFGDGATSSNKYPNHSYTQTGTYKVELTLNSSECGVVTVEKTIVVATTVNASAQFYYNWEACPNENVSFQAQDHNGSSYSWKFGDGATSSGSPEAYHSYAQAGNYAVTLTMTNACGKTASRTDTVRIKTNVAVPDYISINSPSQSCPGASVYFSYNYEGYNQVWYFSDGDSSSQKDVSHTFKTNGVYTVSLKLTNACGNSKTISKNITIGDSGGYGSEAYMQVYGSPACPGTSINFDASDANSHLWNFGDNTTSTQSHPAHIYKVIGTYPVSVKMTNACGKDTTLTSTVVIDGNITPQLTYDDNWGSAGTAACPKDSLVFYAVGGASYHFDFGDGSSTTQTTPIQAEEGIFDVAKHAWTTAGTYTVKFTHYNSCGKSATDSVKVTIGGGQQVQSKLDGDNYGRSCQPMNFMAFGGSTYKYYFGNGDSLITTQNFITYTYKKGGNYTVTLVVSNSCGMSATYTRQVTVEEIKLSASITNVTCIGGNDGAIALSVSGGSDPYSFQWSVGAVNNSIGNLPVGTYTATVTDDNGCKVSGTYEVKLVTNSKYTGSVSIDVGPSPVCPNTEVDFHAAPANGYLWTFGDGSTATTRNAQHVYKTPGTYNVTLKLSSSCGSDTTVKAAVVVDGSLTPVLTNDNYGAPSKIACAKDTMIFYAYGGDHYIWNFGDGASTTETAPLFIQDLGDSIDIARHAYATVGDYTVKLTYFNACGKSVSDSFTVSIGGGQPVDGDIAPSGSVFKACEKVSLTAFGGVNYQWKFGDGDSLITDQGTVQHSYIKGGSYKVTVKITNGCGNSKVYTKNLTIQEIVINSQIKNVLCQGGNTGMIDITVLGGTAPYAYLWSNAAVSEDVKDLKAGQYAVAVTDANGCKATSPIIPVTESTVLAITSTPVSATCGNANGSISVSATGGVKPYTYLWDVNPAVTTTSLTNVNAGTYTVVVTDSNNCSKAISVGVSNSTGPAISAVSGTDETCPDACDGTLSVTATGTGILTYSWSTAVVQTTANVTGVCPGTYVVSVKDGNNCISTSSATIAKAAALTVIVTQKGDSLSSSAATSYQWNKNGTPINGATSKAYKATATGDYSVTVKNANGCSATSVSVNVNVTGINNDRSVSEINMYPNPTLGDAYITYELTNNTQVELTLYDCYGRHIKTFSHEVQGTGKYTQKMELSEIGLPNGIYFVCLKLNNNLYRNRISVVR